MNTIQEEMSVHPNARLSISPIARETASFEHNPPGKPVKQHQPPPRKFIQLPVTEHNRSMVYYPQHQQPQYVYKPTVVTPRIKKVVPAVRRYVPYSVVPSNTTTTYARPAPRYHTILSANKDVIPVIRADPLPQRFIQDS